MVEQTERTEISKLKEKLGDLTYRIGLRAMQMQKLDKEIKSLQVESNNVATQIEELEK